VRSRVPILYVHHRPELGGAPRSLHYLLQALDRDRFEPYVYCPSGPVSELFRDAGVTVIEGPVSVFTHIWASSYRGRRWLLLGREAANLPRHLARFSAVLRRGGYALVHLNDSPLVPAAYVARRQGIPVVWHLRSGLPDDGRDLRSRALRALISRFAATSIAINEEVARTFRIGSHVIPNSVDLERFRPGDSRSAKVALGLSPDLPVVSFFGFIYPSKGFREFIESAGLLRRLGIEAAFLVVGGPVRSEAFFETTFGRGIQLLDLARDHAREARGLVAELGLADRVRFVPYTADPVPLYRASDVVVAPSRGPELGRPVIEAFACGRAIVASGSRDGGGTVVPGETGLLVPRRSADSLAAALRQLLRDGELRRSLGENSRRHAERHFNIETNAAAVMALYERVLAERR
jgi:glycosyltransferase involved in cell wall biosynthesis